MIRVAFCIGGYPPEEFKRRADLALVLCQLRNSSRDYQRRGVAIFLRHNADGDSARRAGVYRRLPPR